MRPRINGSLVMILLLLAMFLSAGMFVGSEVGLNPFHLPHKGGVQANSRKLLAMDGVIDYDYAGPNPKHDPRGRKGGGGYKNP